MHLTARIKNQKCIKSKEEDVNLSFAQLEGKCYCCGKAGHKLPSCRDKNKPREEWAINQAQQSHAQAPASDASTVTSATSNPTSSRSSRQQGESNDNQVGWAGAHIDFQLYQASTMRDWILLDNQSSVTVFCNPNLVTNIRASENGYMHLATNGGSMVTKMKADLPPFIALAKQVFNLFKQIGNCAKFIVDLQ